MKSLMLNNRKIEIIIYAVVWAVILYIPYYSIKSFGFINWHRLTREWIQLLGYLIIFLLNVYILVPKLLFQKKYLYYIGIVCITTIIIIGIVVFLQSGEFFHTRPLPNGPLDGFDPARPMLQHKPFFSVLIDKYIISILVIAAGTTTKLGSKWLSEEKLRKDIEKEQLKTNLALLRHQVSPHFFMNTLNNIHALIDINSENAKDSIVRLSDLMRYLLYDSAQSQIKLKKEINFINSFIALMQLRFSDKVNISVVVPEQIPDIQIPPMLFISFLENAFKHGISYQSQSYIYFELQIFEKLLCCKIRNSKHNVIETKYDEYSGIGLENIKRSLKLLYGDDYKLQISDKETEFEVNLTIPL
jgi:hypothetical protein